MTSPFESQLQETWQINNRINLVLLDNIEEAGFSDTLSARGGRTVAKQFAHLHNVRLTWELCARELLKDQAKIDQDEKINGILLKKRLTESGEAIAKLINQGFVNDCNLKGYKKGLIPMMGYLISHDAHHRGSIFLTLKQCGHKISQEIQYGIWDWGKI